MFGVFREWRYLERDDKRSLLAALAPEIHVADYKVAGISLVASSFSSQVVSHMVAGYDMAANGLVFLPLEMQ